MPYDQNNPLYQLTQEQMDELGKEFDALHDEVYDDLGEADARYIRNMVTFHRRLVTASRAVLLFSRSKPAWVLGTAGLSLAKILENMEIGHNVMHGQWDWMNDPNIHSSTWDWDTASPAAAWKHSHNYVHHTYTNVIGKDKDVGYEIMRIDARQPWKPSYLFQPVYNLLLTAFFEWGVAIHDLDFPRIHSGDKPRNQVWDEVKAIGRKARRQVLKDYLGWPSVSGAASAAIARGRGAGKPGTLSAAGEGYRAAFWADFTANIVRNVWSNAIIFCGHFPDQTFMFTEDEVAERVARRLVRAAADRRGQHRRRPDVPHPGRQPVLPGRAPPVPGHAQLPLPADRAAGEGDLREVRPALQHRAAAQAVGHRAAHHPAPRLPRRRPALQARRLRAQRGREGRAARARAAGSGVPVIRTEPERNRP